MIPAVLVNCCVPHNFQNKLPCIGAIRPVNPGKVFQKFFKAVLHCIFRLFPVVKNPIGTPVHPLFVQLIHGFQQLSKVLLFQGSPPPLFSFIIYNEYRKENLTKTRWLFVFYKVPACYSTLFLSLFPQIRLTLLFYS